MKKKILIIGGGISGIYLGYRLKKRRLFDKNFRRKPSDWRTNLHQKYL